VAIGVSMALLAFIIDPATGKILSTQELTGFAGAMVLILTLLLVCYLADKSKKLAEDWGGKIDASWGEGVAKDLKHLWTLTKSNVKDLKKLGDKK